MRRRQLAAVALFAAGLPAAAGAQADFQRESGPTRAAQDALEGKPAPALQVSQWAGATGLAARGAPTLAALKGKVVLLKFWGVW